MPREINLTSIGGWVPLERNGVTIRVDDPDRPEKSGYLRVGRRIYWKPLGPGWDEKAKDWDDLIDFFMSTT